MTNQEFHHTAVVEIDMKRGFMPLVEGLRLGVEGFGELPVESAPRIVPVANKVVEVALDHNLAVIDVGDAHPEHTAHFSDNPNFVDTWPQHCVDGTPGAESHPELVTVHDPRVLHFKKGDVAARTPAEDNSYTAALAHRTDPETGVDQLLPDYLRAHGIWRVIEYGLTESLDKHLCLGTSALDLLAQGFQVAIVEDAMEPLVPGTKDECLRRLGQAGIQIINSHEAVAELARTPEVIR
jgi:nicotinamidase/pyrazinamidase